MVAADEDDKDKPTLMRFVRKLGLGVIVLTVVPGLWAALTGSASADVPSFITTATLSPLTNIQGAIMVYGNAVIGILVAVKVFQYRMMTYVITPKP